MHNSDPTPQGVGNRNILMWFKCVLTTLHVNCMILFDKVLYLEQGKQCTLEWNSVVIKDRERDAQVLQNVKVYFKWGLNKSPFDAISAVFHFHDFNYGRWSHSYCFWLD